MKPRVRTPIMIIGLTIALLFSSAAYALSFSTTYYTYPVKGCKSHPSGIHTLYFWQVPAVIYLIQRDPYLESFKNLNNGLCTDR